MTRLLFPIMTPLQLKKYLLLVCFSGIVFSVFVLYNRDTDLDEGYYLVLFETNSKIAPHLRTFNRIVGSRYNHIGLLVRKFPTNQLLHVHPDYRGTHNIIAQLSLHEFVANDAKICEIWQIDLTALEAQKLQHGLDSISHCKTIHYDYAFDLGNNNLYCSEFVYQLFKSMNVKKFRFLVSKDKLQYPLNLLYRKDSITYIPVDFFKTNTHFTPVKWN